MKPSLLLALLLAAATPANAKDCDLAAAEEILALALPEEASATIDVAEQQSVEGGAWTVYNGKAGKPQRIVRTDYGETGRAELLLALADGNAFIIRKAIIRYAAPIYESGSAVVREERDYYRFCNGKLSLPPNWETDEVYLKAARDAADQFFTAAEIVGTVKSAGLKPPLWK